MANSTVKIDLNLVAKGIKEANTDASHLRGNLEGAQKAAGSIKTVAAAKQAPGSAAINSANMAVTAGSIDDKAYGKVRGTVGTGAAGRDFAKQSQGLGGVVQLYATFAANLFAVGAAYEALNKAAAAERLAKATEMMSVQVGANLKGISNNLVEASGHALSFQDAMQFTNIGTSAGLAGKQIESLTKIARGAASALGRDVNDSVRRIIQGTAKQEQEILDELGIFVKSKQAFDKYSKEIGVKADDLTGRQRTQAYANEVERLGKKWEAFAEIDDPFSKFAATGKNALNDLLQSVNQFVKPVLAMLSESEGSIKAIIILISTMLAKRALPELGGMFNGIFNYDKQLAQKAATDRMKDLNTEAANIKSFVTKNITEIEKLNSAKMLSRVSMTNTLDSLAAKSQGGGKVYTPGLAMRPLITDLLGGGPGKESIDLKKLSDVEHVETRITKNLSEQVKKHGEIDGYMQALISKGLIAEGTSKNNIILGDKAKAAALEISKISSTDLEKLLITNALTKENITANKHLLDIDNERVKLVTASPKGTFTDNAANIAANTAEAASLDKLAASESKAAAASTIHADSNKLEAVSSGLSATAINTETIALEKNAFISKAASKEEIKGSTAKAGKDISIASTGNLLDIGKLGKASFSGMGEVLAKTGSELSKVTGGMGLYSSAANIGKIASISLSGGLGVLKLGIQGIIGAFSMVLGPLMLAWTAWEMFGDSIKGWLGVDVKAQQALEEQAKKQKEYSEATGLAAMSMKNLNSIKATGYESSSEYVKGLDLEITVLTEQINRIKQLYKEKEDAAKTSTLADLRKTAESKGELFNEESLLMREQAISEELAGNTNVANSLRALADVSDTVTKQRILSSKSINELTGKEADTIYLTKDAAEKSSAAIRTAHVSIMESNLKVKNQESASAEAIKNGASLVSKSYEELSDKQKKMRDEESGLTQHAKGVYDGLNKQLVSTNVTALSVAETMAQLGTRTIAGGKDAASAAILFNVLSAVLQGAQKAGTDGNLITDVTKLNQLLKEAEPTIRLLNLAIGKSLSTPLKPKAIKEYDDAAKALFTRIKGEIKDTTSEMHILDMQTANTSAMDARTTAILGYQTAQSIQSEQESANNKARLQEYKSMEEAYLEYERVMQSKTKGPEEKKEAKAQLGEKIDAAVDTRAIAENTARIAAENKTIQTILAQQNIEYEKAKTLTENSDALQLATLGIDSARLEVLRNSGIYKEEELVAMSGALQQRTAEITLAQQVNALEAERANKLKALQVEFLTTSMTYETYKQAEGQLNSSLDARKAQMQGLADIARTILGITLEQEASQARANDRLKEMAGIAESLTGVFGDLGSSMAGAMEAIRNSNDLSLKNSKDLLDAEDKLAKAKEESSTARKELGPNSKEYKDAAKVQITEQDKVDKLKKKSEKDELSSIAKTAGATKKMFAEKTAAYKLLDGIEKAASMMKLAMDAKEMASDIMKFGQRIGLIGAETSADVAGTGVKAAAELGAEALTLPAKISGAIASLFSSSGFLAFGLVGAMLAMIGGGSSKQMSPVGLTAEDMQKSQGTGQSWVDGKLVDNGGGVFGDTTAKSNSIQNSLELLTATSVEGLSFANDQTKLLKKINDGIGEVAKATYTSVGIRTGTDFGTIEKSTSNPGLLGLFASSSSTEIINAGIKLKGTFDSLSSSGKGSIQKFETVQSTKTNSGILGLFSSSKTSINTSFKALETKAETAIRETFDYMGEFLVEQGSLLGLTAEATLARANSITIDVEASLRGLTGSETQEELNAIFSGILDDAAMAVAPQLIKFRSFGEGFAETVTRVIDGFDKVNLSLTSMGLGLLEFTEVPTQVTTQMLEDQTTAKIALDEAKSSIPTLTYSWNTSSGTGDSGGGLETMTNQSDIDAANKTLAEAQKVYDAYTKIVTDAERGVTTRGYDLSEALIKAAGGLDKFIESAQLYSEMFLTESDRLIIKQTAVKTRLSDISTSGTESSDLFRSISDGNDSIINTKEEYKSLIDAALEGAKAVVAEEDTIGLARKQAYVDLYADLTDPALLQSQKDIWEAEEELTNSRREQAKEILTLNGRSRDAMLMDREDKLAELALIDESLVIGQRALYSLEDVNTTKELELELMDAQGYTLSSLNATREEELSTLSESDKLIKQKIYAAQDEAKTYDLLTELATAQGNSTEAVLRSRTKEIKGLSASDAALKIRIWQLQDETALLEKKNAQEVAIYNLLGNSAAALQITREKELATMDEQLKPAQLYLYALQDEATLKGKLKTAYDKEKSAIKSTIDSLSGFIKTLKDARDAMLTGDKSPLTPAERYAEAKQQAYAVAAIATGIATTDAEIAARNDAISKLPSVTGTFLDASRDLYASSEQYTQDFNSVLKLLDDTSSILSTQQTDAEKQLTALTSMDTTLASLLEEDRTANSYLVELKNLAPGLEALRQAAAAAGSVASGGTNINPTSNNVPSIPINTTSSALSYFNNNPDVSGALTPFISSKGISEGQLSAIHYAYWGKSEGRAAPSPLEPINSEAAANAFGVSRSSVLEKALESGVPAFAKGGLASGLSMVGEQGPELIDFKTPTRVYSNTASNQLLSNQELIQEIRNLRKEVETLRTEQKEQTGHLIQSNYDSNAQAAKAIANATEEASAASLWAQRSQLKLA